MIYLDNAATGGKKPDTVITAVNSAVAICANPGRSGHKLSLACANTVQKARYALMRFFDGYAYDRVVFTKNCTEALNIALLGVLQRGDHVVTTCMEHNSILRPLEKLKRDGIISYDICPLDKNGSIQPEQLRSLLRKNTRMVAITAASNVNGATTDLAAVKKVLPSRVLLMCDGAQAGGHFPLKMRELGIDLLAVAGHKGLMGIQGGGALLFSERVDPAPIFVGGTGSMSMSLQTPDFYPDALEAGTLSFPAISALLEGVSFVEKHLSNIQKHALELTAYLIDGLNAIDGITVYSVPNACGIVAFALEGMQSEYAANVLSTRYDIALRGGLHCAPLMHEALGTLDDGLLRASFSLFNTKSDVHELLFALQEMRMEN